MTSAATQPSKPPLSLLSLSDAAASVHHIPVQHQHQQVSAPPAVAPIPIKQRRRSSFSQNRKRRSSDARDHLMNFAEDRDRVTSSRLQMSLSLSPPSAPHGLISKSAPLDGMKEESSQPSTRKKATIFRCESCAKVYRHPSCLVKHRWEHSPHWREASKFLLSKHQQVQLLEAAAILSHLSPTESGGGTSLPEDRSLWPSYLSGGLLPLPNGAHLSGQHHPTSTAESGDMSTSEDEQDRDRDGVGRPTLTQFRPGLLGHPNPTPIPPMSASGEGGHAARSAPVPVPGREDTSASGGASWVHTPYSSTSGPFSMSMSYSSSERGWSLPKSSVRGVESDEEGDEGVVVVEEGEGEGETNGNGKGVGKQEEEWDGMEMEMDL